MSPASDRLVRSVPNAITVVRGLAIPVIAWLLAEQRYLAAFWTLVASAVSDLTDGQIARRYNARTRFGEIADPVTDKLTMLTVAVALAWQGLLPLWLAAAIVIRDIVIVAGAVAYHRYIGPVEMSPTRLSKLNTALEFVVLATVLADAAQLVEAGALLSVLFTLVCVTVIGSGLQYVVLWSRRARAARRTLGPRPV
jgi:cardiolipin synthase (CMP-forming)